MSFLLDTLDESACGGAGPRVRKSPVLPDANTYSRAPTMLLLLPDASAFSCTANNSASKYKLFWGAQIAPAPRGRVKDEKNHLHEEHALLFRV